MSLVPDPTMWERRGASWYKLGVGGSNPYHVGTCERCGHAALMNRKQHFCGHSCASRSYSKPVPGYYGAHTRVKRQRGPARNHACVDCFSRAREWSYDGADPAELTDPRTGYRYSADPSRYVPRCNPCHARHDHGGERNCRAFHSDAKVAEILAEYRAGGITQTALAVKYGVSQATISAWVVGRNRHHSP